MPKYCKILSGQRGYSLLELVVVITITSIIAGILARFVVFGMNSYSFLDQRKELLRDARLAIHFMNRDFRQIRNDNGITTAQAQLLQYFDYSDRQFTYRYENNEIKRNGHLLASGVTDFEFRYIKSDGKYMQVPVAVDSLDYIWNVEAEFRIARGQHSQRYVVLVHPRNY